MGLRKMMDIVERLNRAAAQVEPREVERTLLDAAAEIERLRVERSMTGHEKDMLIAGLKHDLKKAAAKIERLRGVDVNKSSLTSAQHIHKRDE